MSMFIVLNQFLCLYVPLKNIQICLGHSNFQTTLRYSHANVEDKRISANVISNTLELHTKKITEVMIYVICFKIYISNFIKFIL